MYAATGRVGYATLTAARRAADVLDVPTVLLTRTDRDTAKLIARDVDPATVTCDGSARFEGRFER